MSKKPSVDRMYSAQEVEAMRERLFRQAQREQTSLRVVRFQEGYDMGMRDGINEVRKALRLPLLEDDQT